MSGNDRVWVNTKGPALSFLKTYEEEHKGKPKKEGRAVKPKEAEVVIDAEPVNGNVGGGASASRKNQNKMTSLVKNPNGKVVRAVSNVMPLPPMPALEPAELLHVRKIFDETLGVFNLSEPEGVIDMLFTRMDHRIQKKLERAGLLEEYKAAFIRHLRQFRETAEELQAMNALRRKEHLEILEATHRATEEQLKIAALPAEFARQEALAEARTKAEIADLERGPRVQGETEEPQMSAKERLQRDIERLDHEEAVDIVKLTGSRPETEWTDKVKDDVERIRNMYEHAREKKRKKLAEVL